MTTAAPQGTNGNGTAIEKRKLSRMDVLKESFDKWKPTLKMILPKHIDPDRVIRIAMNVFLNKPELQTCSPISMVRATLQCAELGLDPSPLLGECAFVPFNNTIKVKDGNQWVSRKVEEVQLMPMYLGLIKLCKQTGDIADVYAVVVDECDAAPTYDEHGNLVSGFAVEEGTVRSVKHKPDFAKKTGKLYAVYGVVKFKDGTHHFEVLTKKDVDAIRERSKSKDNGAWVTDYQAMAKKTAIKQALKTVPKSPEKPALPTAIALDNAGDIGEAFSTSFTEAMDAEGVDTTEPPAAQSRTEELAAKLAGPVAHDKDGVVK
jgi:recombination protein RecT